MSHGIQDTDTIENSIQDADKTGNGIKESRIQIK